MARGKKFRDQSSKKETPASKLMETIIEDVIKVKQMPLAEWRALSSNPLVPLAIPVSQGGQYPVTQLGVEAAHALTLQSWKLLEELRQSIHPDAFTRLSFQAIGDTLRDCPSRLPEVAGEQKKQSIELHDDFYDVLVDDYHACLQKLAISARHDVDRHIPCYLFHLDQAVPAFAVGPVQFRPRSEWLDYFIKEAEVRELIGHVESRDLDMEALRSQSMDTETGRHAASALDILRTLSHYNWVATIRMEEHEHTQSHLKASIMVGLAIDAIGLRFHVEDARRFTKAGRQHLFAENRLATTLDGQILRGSSVQMPGLGGRPGDLAGKMASEQPFLDLAGTILQSYVDGRRSGHALHLVERWVNALYWVGEARREVSDFMAVVNYGCAADGLSGAGGSAGEMTVFAEAALKPADDSVATGGITIDAAVNKVYREGRNKLAHGEMSGLLEDLAEPRAVGEALLSALFDVVTPVLADILQNEPNLIKIDEKRAYRLLKAKLSSNKACDRRSNA